MSDDKEENSKVPEAEAKATEDEPKFTYDYERSAESHEGDNEHSRPQRQGEDLAGKLFLGGVSWQTTLEGLKYHFERIGELKDAALFTDKKTGQSKGFAFVTFKDPAGINKKGAYYNTHTFRLLSVEVT
jgi:RNA recognition motif-containing protein